MKCATLPVAMSLKKVLPYILATLLLGFLMGMVQTPKVLLKGKTGNQVNAQESIEGYFYLPVGSSNVSAISQQDYVGIIGRFIAHNYNRVVSETGLPLYVALEWENPYFGAFAKKNSDTMQISLWGGMARAPGATPGALAAILCHELGHIVGGQPRQTIPGVEWSSSEGQSDFFAASQCLPSFLNKYPDLVSSFDPEVMAVCKENLTCARTLQAGLEMSRLLQKYSYREYVPVSLNVTEKETAELLRNKYPSDQCRLDTFKNGALCQLGNSCRAPSCWFPKE